MALAVLMHNVVLLTDKSNAHAHLAISEIQLLNAHLERALVQEIHVEQTQDAVM